MGFGDKLKGLRDQAQQAVVDNKDRIQGAVQTVGDVANTKTKGKYADKISKVGDKVSSSDDKMGSDQQGPGSYDATATTTEAPETPAAMADGSQDSQPAEPQTAPQDAPPAGDGTPPDFE